jgi:16S rRNA processing protein RimM
MSDLVAVGRVVGVFGSRGSLRISSLTDFPSRILKLRSVYLVGEEIEQHQVLSVDTHRQGYRMTLSGVDSTQKASTLIGCYLSVPEHQLEPLPEGVYYAFEIVGLAAYTEDGERIGDVVELLELPGSDVLVIDRGGREVLVPMVSQFIKEINADEKRIVVTPIEGMLGQE